MGQESDDLPKRLEYQKLPKEIEAVIGEERAELVEDASVTFDGRQFLVRFPKNISERLGLSREHKVRFTLIMPKPRTSEPPKLTIEVVKDGV